MKTLTNFAILNLCFLGSTTISARSIVFSPAALQKAIPEICNGEVQIIEIASHNRVRHITESFTFIKNWFSTL